MFALSKDIGIDLGTANVLIYQRGRGIVLREPSVAAISKSTKELKAVGEDARQMLGREPNSIEVIQPIRDGVIANLTVTQQMLAEFLRRVLGGKFFFKPRVKRAPKTLTPLKSRWPQPSAPASTSLIRRATWWWILAEALQMRP
jgi:rod shape-determining protein MreB